MCKINPKIDFAFKKLFGSEENKDLTISLINSIVSEEDQVKTIDFVNPYNLKAYKEDKLSILDIKAIGTNDKHFNIEMQMGEDRHFDKKAIYYWAKLLTGQIKESELYKDLKKTISISLLDYKFTPNTDYHNIYKIINAKTGQDDFPLNSLFELHFIELKKFGKAYEEVVTAQDRWITFLNRAKELDKNNLPASLQDDLIKRATQEVDKMFDEEEREIYTIRQDAIRDVLAKIEGAKEAGLEQGIEQGIRIVAQNMLSSGISPEVIMKGTGLTKEEILKLNND